VVGLAKKLPNRGVPLGELGEPRHAARDLGRVIAARLVEKLCPELG
jgi:hypothetical protein